ncbi:Glycosyl transferases group 1 [Pseudobythopirellula maris]|uniref:Glycosyl transferases group 1 n=1 Tax=Pseudobythopirellula maris TaxID=2527991 RepID=A0A5C5ZPT6_9BACT|nr:glycosyltransferase [Pseudobythopirellula maris]TWT88927.1 Glycosyl transferases group 1 [Pseudobythopirellula maris]
MPKVLHVVTRLAYSGATTQLERQTEALAAAGWESRVVALRGLGPVADRLASRGVAVELAGQRFGSDPIAYTRLLLSTRCGRPDAVVTWDLDAGRYGLRAARGAGVRRVVHCARGGPGRASWRRARTAARIAGAADAVVTPEEAVVAAWRELSSEPSRVVLHADTVAAPGATVEQKRTRRNAFAEELGAPAETKWIAAVGPLKPGKRLKELLWAIDLLRLTSEVRLLVVGAGPQLGALRRFAHQLRVADEIVFVGPRDDWPALLSACDMLWCARRRAQPTPVLESLAAGTPVVASPGSNALISAAEQPPPPGLVRVAPDDRTARCKATLRLWEHPPEAIAAPSGGEPVAALQSLAELLSASRPRGAQLAVS